MEACLGIPSIVCSYDATTSQSVFSIGEWMTVIGLLLAFLALIKPITNFRLRVAALSRAFVLLILIGSFVCNIIAIGLRLNIGWRWIVVGYPLFWELLAAFILFFLVIYGLVVSLKSARFSRRNAKRYYESFLGVIARGDYEEMAAMATEISSSIDAVIFVCSEYEKSLLTRKPETPAKQPSMYVRLAYSVLDAWSDPMFCRAMVLRDPGTAIKLLTGIANNHYSDNFGRAVIQEIINQALSETECMLYREKQFSPLGRQQWLSKAIIGDYRFFCHHRPLQSWHWEARQHANQAQLEKFGELLILALQEYFKTKQYWEHPSALWTAYQEYAQCTRQIIWNVRRNGSTQTDEEAFSKLYVIGKVLSDSVKLIANHEEELPIYASDETTSSNLGDHSIYAVLSDAIYQFLESLAVSESNDESVRFAATEIWFTIFPSSSDKSESKTINEIRCRLVPQLKEKITDNLDSKARYYPALTRLLLSLIGIYPPKSSAYSDAEADFYQWFKTAVIEYYPDLAATDPDFAKKLLPETMTYDAHTYVLTSNRLRGEPISLQLKMLQQNRSE